MKDLDEDQSQENKEDTHKAGKSKNSGNSHTAHHFSVSVVPTILYLGAVLSTFEHSNFDPSKLSTILYLEVLILPKSNGPQLGGAFRFGSHLIQWWGVGEL